MSFIRKDLRCSVFNTIFSIITKYDCTPMFLPSQVTDDYFISYKPDLRIIYNDNRSYADLINNLWRGNNCSRFEIKNEDTYVNIALGYMTDKHQNILLILTTKGSTNINDNITLFVATEFVNNPEYKLLYNKLYKEYISEFIKKDMNVSFMPSNKIENYVFNKPNMVKYNTITEFQDFLQSKTLNNLLFANEQE